MKSSDLFLCYVENIIFFSFDVILFFYCSFPDVIAIPKVKQIKNDFKVFDIAIYKLSSVPVRIPTTPKDIQNHQYPRGRSLVSMRHICSTVQDDHQHP